MNRYNITGRPMQTEYGNGTDRTNLRLYIMVMIISHIIEPDLRYGHSVGTIRDNSIKIMDFL